MKAQRAPWHYLLLLILAGESAFILPFVLARVFRPTVLEAFGLSNVELGLCFSVYGLVALVSYLGGGPLADRVAPRRLIAVALWMTALGGLVYATFPGFTTLQVLYGYWGFTTIFLFWAPMIKATRAWGGPAAQGKAFGFLDGGRGLVGALFGTLGVLVFAAFLTSGIEAASPGERQDAFRQVIRWTSALVALVGVLVWFFLKSGSRGEKEIRLERITRAHVAEVLRLPSVWLLMLIILCGYVGYKLTDDFSLYAREVMGYDPVESAQMGTFLLFIRPVIGIGIGLLADRTRTTLVLLFSFLVAAGGSLLFALGWVQESAALFFLIATFIVAAGVYAVRAIYFAVMERGRIPLLLTGTAVGLVSLVGYTPDIFAGPAMGYLLDSSPGMPGHRHVFWMLAGFSLAGAVAAWIYHRLYGRG